ncbi:MAG: hypothetical protein CMK07_04515 [Ponticaulis sp.]|nr:hypothetical protein [Ponticaulis sp.]
MGNDRKGILATALVGVNTQQEWLSSGGIEMGFAQFEQLVKEISCPLKLQKALFGGRLTYFLSTIESLWVYLYLSFEAEQSLTAIAKNVDRIVSDNFDGLRPWHLKKMPSESVIELFRVKYENAK